MISKVAIQSVLGLVLIGGVSGGISVLQLNKQNNTDPTISKGGGGGIADVTQLSSDSSDDADATPFEKSTEEYLVQVDSNVGNDQPKEELKETNNKNYFCKWKENNQEKTDQNCIIKQIKFDDKKLVLLSEVVRGDNFSAFETTTNNKLKIANTWFLLKVTGYTDDLGNYDDITNIDILSTTPEKDKKYTTVIPKFKLSNNKATQGKVNLVLVKYKKNTKTNGSSLPLEDCNYATSSNTTAGSTCNVYKFKTQPTGPITSLDLTDASKITYSSQLEDDNYYIIYFYQDAGNEEASNTSDEVLPLFAISINAWVDSVIFAKKDINSQENEKFEFTVIHSIAANTITNIFPKSSENLVLLN